MNAVYTITRTVDIVAGAVLFTLSIPLLFIISLFIKLTSPGPVLYRQRHSERAHPESSPNTTDRLYKFRTMAADAKKTTESPWSQKCYWKITPVGRFLRRSGLDKLPQSINVLKGDLSLFPPKPEQSKGRLHAQ